MKYIPLDKLKIRVRHLIRPTYCAWGFGFLALLFAIQGIVVWVDGNKRIDRTIEKYTYIKDRIAIDKIHTENDRYTKITTFYTEIVSTYFHKFHKKYNKKNKWMYQGLNDHQIARIINLWYRGCRDLNIPYMIPPSISVRESSGNPLARTFNKDGSILEAGLYNQRRGAAIQAFYYNSLLPSHLQIRYAFKFNKMEDLFNPDTATKVELCLLWGELMYFKNNRAIGVTARHWGNTKIDRLVKNGIYPPKDFKFNIDKIDEDVRNPFTYYFIINQYVSAFEKFTTKVRLDTRYDKIYRAKCSKMERNYINTKRYFQDFTKLYNEMDRDAKAYAKRVKKRDKKFEKKVKDFNVYCIETQKSIKSGNFKKIKDIWNVFRVDLRKFVKDIEKEKNNKIRVQIKILLIVIALFILGLLSSLIRWTIKYFILKREHVK